MSGFDWLKLRTPPGRLDLGKGYSLGPLRAQEVLEARREAMELAREGREQALCANACLLSRFLWKRRRRAYPSGAAVLEALTVENIQGLTERWAAFCREEDPGLGVERGRLEALKKAWSTRRRSGCGGACSERSGPCPRRSGQRPWPRGTISGAP